MTIPLYDSRHAQNTTNSICLVHFTRHVEDCYRKDESKAHQKRHRFFRGPPPGSAPKTSPLQGRERLRQMSGPVAATRIVDLWGSQNHSRSLRGVLSSSLSLWLLLSTLFPSQSFCFLRLYFAAFQSSPAVCRKIISQWKASGGHRMVRWDLHMSSQCLSCLEAALRVCVVVSVSENTATLMKCSV